MLEFLSDGIFKQKHEQIISECDRASWSFYIMILLLVLNVTSSKIW